MRHQYKSYDYTKMTEQEVMEASYNHVIAQGCKAFDDERGRCVYRGPGGVQCAASIFIPKYRYRSHLEGEPWSIVVDKLKLSNKHVVLIEELQRAHDYTDGVGGVFIRRYMRRIGMLCFIYSLKCPF